MIGPTAIASTRMYGAMSQVASALRRKELTRAAHCANCGGKRNIEAHHEDYNRPLDVKWLCRKCHAARHVELRGLGIFLMWEGLGIDRPSSSNGSKRNGK